MKHSAKVISKHTVTGAITAYSYRDVVINIDYTRENKFTFNNVSGNGDVLESSCKTLAIAKGRIDRAINDNRIK